jgi:hypothetical protein
LKHAFSEISPIRTRLAIATTIDREVQVERQRRGIGTRIDLTVTTPAVTYTSHSPARDR